MWTEHIEQETGSAGLQLFRITHEFSSEHRLNNALVDNCLCLGKMPGPALSGRRKGERVISFIAQQIWVLTPHSKQAWQVINHLGLEFLPVKSHQTI